MSQPVEQAESSTTNNSITPEELKEKTKGWDRENKKNSRNI